jgi:hypothetical protein
MVSKNNITSRSQLKYYRDDPNNQKRGKGFYYNRTWKDEGFSTKYMSKYDSKRDYAIGKKTGGSRRYAHFTDKPKEAGSEIDKHRSSLSSDGKYYGTQHKKTYSRDKTTKYFQKKVGVSKYNRNAKSSKKYAKKK